MIKIHASSMIEVFEVKPVTRVSLWDDAPTLLVFKGIFFNGGWGRFRM